VGVRVVACVKGEQNNKNGCLGGVCGERVARGNLRQQKIVFVKEKKFTPLFYFILRLLSHG
jgi:hypothetical protein